MRQLLVAAAFAVIAFSGCLDSEPQTTPTQSPGSDEWMADGFQKVPGTVMASFEESVVTAAYGYAADLYEPTMEVSDSGVIYVTGHTIGADTTGAPVFFSRNSGQTWEQLPFAQSLTMPAGIHGATPPPSDEIFLVAGADGQVWGVDITLATFPINGWCDDGASHCYHNPNAYDEVQAMTARGEVIANAAGVSETGTSCSIANLNDRPWVAYGNGKLLLVNNPGGGPVQVGLMDVPPALPAGGPTVGPTGAQWNLCAGEGSGAIPGIPEMREDHFFAVPQVQGDKLVIVKGHGNVNDVEQVTVFNNTNTGGGTSNYGQVVFDQGGDMFVGIRNNTREDANGNRTGQLHLAVSQDDGETFMERTLVLSSPATSIYMDGNIYGEGALLTWAQIGDTGTDWYAAHMYVGSDGLPVVRNVMLIYDEGTPPSAHVQGAALGPNGEAYMVSFHGGYQPQDRANPLHVWIQRDGPMMNQL